MSQDIEQTEENNESIELDYIISELNVDHDKEIGEHLEQQHAADIADVLESLPPELRQQLWKQMPQDKVGETLTYLGEEVLHSIIDEMESDELVAATGSMDVEDLAEVMEELPPQIIEAVLKSLDGDRLQRLETTLAFEDGSAGRLMSTDVISVRKDVSLAVVIRFLRRQKPLPLHTDAIMVTDAEGLYQGKLLISDIVSELPSRNSFRDHERRRRMRVGQRKGTRSGSPL